MCILRDHITGLCGLDRLGLGYKNTFLCTEFVTPGLSVRFDSVRFGIDILYFVKFISTREIFVLPTTFYITIYFNLIKFWNFCSTTMIFIISKINDGLLQVFIKMM